MELRLPAHYADLTLRHLMALESDTDPVKRVSAVTGVPYDKLRTMPRVLITEADAHLTTLLQKEQAQHKPIIELGGVTYGFIPNWEDFSTGEWIDMEDYTKDFWRNAHKAMSVLYRPIDRRWGDKYTIAPYTAKEDAEAFLEMPAPLVSGALLFFWTTERELLTTLQSSLIQTTREAMRLLRSGDGTRSSSPWLGRIISRWMRLRLRLSATSSPTSHS